MTLANQAQRRRRQRGAAMVEAAMVMPVLVSFFVLNQFVWGTYRAKNNVELLSRNATMYMATHACTQGLPGSSQGPQQPVGNQSDPLADNVDQGAKYGAEKVTGMSGDLIGAAVGNASGGWSYFGRSRSVKSDSFVICNEQLWGGDDSSPIGASAIKGFFSFGLNFFMSMFGL